MMEEEEKEKRKEKKRGEGSRNPGPSWFWADLVLGRVGFGPSWFWADLVWAELVLGRVDSRAWQTPNKSPGRSTLNHSTNGVMALFTGPYLKNKTEMYV